MGARSRNSQLATKAHKTQNKKLMLKAVLFILIACGVAVGMPQQSDQISVDVFQVLEMPLTVHEATLKRSTFTYLLKISLGNSSDERTIGLRYSLVRVNTKNGINVIASRSEGFSLDAYATKTLTFKSPIKFTPRNGERLVLMLEQVVSRESIWEVVKAKEALETYARGDYSVTPTVLHVANQVDAPPDARPTRKLYERYERY